MKILKVLLLFCLATGFMACSNDDDENSSDAYTPGNTPAPNWTVTNQTEEQDDPMWTVIEDIDRSSSMTLILRIAVLADSLVSTDDTMAAFIDGKCVGKANVMETEYGKRIFLYVNCPNNMQDSKVTLKYYNTQLRTSYVIDDFETPFVTDAAYGHVEDPCAFNAIATDGYVTAVGRWFLLPDYLVDNLSDNDEIAVYVGDECRLVKGTNLSVITSDGTTYVQCLIPVNKDESGATLRYYSANLKRAFVSSTFDITAGIDYRIYSDVGFTEMK